MSSRRSTLGALALALTTAVTVWLVLLPWRDFTEADDSWLAPFLVAAVAASLLGVALRLVRVPAAVVALAQLALGAGVVSLVITGSALPTGQRWLELREAFSDAQASIVTWAAPVPSEAASIAPVLLVSAWLVLVSADLLASGVGSVPLAGLVLLAAYTVPVGLLDTGVVWWVFVLAALGFLMMLFLQEHHSLAQWGRSLAAPGAERGSAPLTSRSYRGTALTTALAAAVCAALVGALVPTLDTALFGGGRGPGGPGDVEVVNPMVDLRRDLQRGRDVDLLRINTDDPDPAYLRLTALTRFSDNSWSPGDREIPRENLAEDLDLPRGQGVSGELARTSHAYEMTATADFSSTWLPLFQEATYVDAPGEWLTDLNTRDFLNPSGEPDQIREMTWTQRADRIAYDEALMAQAPRATGQVSATLTDLPDSFPSEATSLAIEVTSGANSPYEKAVRLQRWFQEEGGFRYNLNTERGNGADDLMAFLGEGEGARQGYCEQFAAAMAALARSLGIPARVGVGFLRPTKTGDDQFVYSSHDLHAWPELYITGSGWVVFEPTPASHVRTLPSWSQHEFTQEPSSPTTSASTSPSASASASPTARPTVAPETPETDPSTTEAQSFPWRWLLGGALLLGLLVLAGLAPRLVRAARRRARVGRGGAEDAWAELHDTAVDLGLPWPEDTSTRAVAHLLAPWVGEPGNDDELPRTGVRENPEAAAALERLSREVERARYARPGSWEPGDVSADARAVVEGWTYGASRSVRRRAHWWPRSVLRKRRDTGSRVSGGHTSLRADEVDHVQ